MRKILLYILAMIAPVYAYCEQWRLHPTYDGNLERIVDTPDYTWLLSRAQPYLAGKGDFGQNYITLFRYDKKGEEMQSLTPDNILSESIIRTIEYNGDKKYIVVAYKNGNIDLFYDNGEKKNVPGLKLSGSEYLKNINGITFSPDHDEIYLATDFGYIIIDDEKGEIKRTVNFEQPLNTVARIGSRLAIGTESGVYSMPFKNYPRFDEFEFHPGFSKVVRMMPVGDRLYVLTGDSPYYQTAYMEVKDGIFSTPVTYPGTMVSMEANKKGILISGQVVFWIVDAQGKESVYMRQTEDFSKNVTGWSGNEFWVDNKRDGLCLKKGVNNESGETSWTLLKDNMRPNASNAFKVTYMACHPDYGMLVRNAGVDGRLANADGDVPDLISGYKNGEWSPRSSTYLAPAAVLYQRSPKGVAIDPKNRNYVYSGSVYSGLMRLDLSDPAKSFRIGNEIENHNGDPRFVAVHPDFKKWPYASPFSNPSFDNSGNLWVAWYDHDKQQNNVDNLEFWYWTPEDRLASRDATSFRPLGKLKIKGVSGKEQHTFNALTYSASKNYLVYFSGACDGPLVIYDTNGTLDDTSDDKQVSLTTLLDRDGGGTFSASYLLCVYEDQQTGDVWVGHSEGVFRLSPQYVMKNGNGVNRIKVSRNDGTNQADYLLSGVRVNCITSDPSGRKWFSTVGGGVVITSADGTQVLKTYTAENSPLPANTIYGLCYNPENNSMMISTEHGLAEVFLSATSSGEGNAKSDVKVYPNPVRPDYLGYVNIEGLQDNALVKVVDAGGHLIKEIGFAAGGEAQWDVTNLNAVRVPGGVYYILATGGPDGDAFSAVGKVLVVN